MTAPGPGAVGRGMDWLLVAVFAVLPALGLVSGASYAGLIFGLGVVRFLRLLAVRRDALTVDRGQLLLAVAFVTLCWASAAWSVIPHHSLAGAWQMTAVLAGTLVVLAGCRSLPDAMTRALGAALGIAFVAGAAIIGTDRLLGSQLQDWLAAGKHASKFNRGIAYSLLIVWPLLGYWIRGRKRPALAAGIALAMLFTLATGVSSTAQVAALAAVAALALAWWAPRLAEPVVAAGTVVLAATLPLAMRLLSPWREALVPIIKTSLMHRLEIWDYMSARVMERPLFGWGLWGSGWVPIRPEELKHYIWVDGAGNYPHNQWMQLWVELGFAGIAVALASTVAALAGIRRLSPGMRPFAMASFATAMTISCADFEFTTDSWWAALAATVVLFRVLDSGLALVRVPAYEPRSRVQQRNVER